MKLVPALLLRLLSIRRIAADLKIHELLCFSWFCRVVYGGNTISWLARRSMVRTSSFS